MIRYASKREIQRYLREKAWGAGMEEDSTRGWEYPFVLENLKLREGLRILDAGCGRSELGMYCAKRGCRVCGSDRSDVPFAGGDSGAGIDRALAAERGVEIDYRVEDIRAMGWKDGSFDAVICVSVLEHLEVMPPRLAALDEMARVLDWGGRLIITVDLYPRDNWYLDLLTHNTSLRLLDRSAVPRPVDDVFADPDTHFDRKNGWGGLPFTSVGFVLVKRCPVVRWPRYAVREHLLPRLRRWTESISESGGK